MDPTMEPKPSRAAGNPPGHAPALGEPEPWAPWETRLCLWSLALGVAALIVLAVLLEAFLR